MLSVSQKEVEDHQTQSEGRRLSAAAFQAQCTQGYVDCDDGKVNGDPSTSCATACGVDCCIGDYACNKFTGKGESRRFIRHVVL